VILHHRRRTRPLWQVDAVIHTQRLGGDEVAAHHADAGPAWGVGEPHGELGGDVVLQTAAHLLDDGETGIVGDPDPLVILGLMPARARASSFCGREPNTSTRRIPKVCSRAMSLTMLAKLG
jgi:hypothetical protein